VAGAGADDGTGAGHPAPRRRAVRPLPVRQGPAGGPVGRVAAAYRGRPGPAPHRRTGRTLPPEPHRRPGSWAYAPPVPPPARERRFPVDGPAGTDPTRGSAGGEPRAAGHTGAVSLGNHVVGGGQAWLPATPEVSHRPAARAGTPRSRRRRRQRSTRRSANASRRSPRRST